jgi:5-methylthioadenosine/S-adenosylhomocysteine deaminase
VKSTDSGDLVLTASWVLPVISPPIREGAVRVRDGRILSVGTVGAVLGQTGASGEAPGTPLTRIDLGEAALLPGFVNVHTHLEITCLRGYCEGLDFFPWIRRLTKVKSERLRPEDFGASVRWGALEALRGGVTTVGDCGDSGQVLDGLLESGLRAIVFQEVFGPDEKDCGEKLAALEATLDRLQSGFTSRVRPGVSPHAPYTVSEPLFRGVKDLALARDLPLSIHVGESQAERLLVRDGEGAFADFLRSRGISWRARGISPLAYLADMGVLEARPLLVHAIDVDSRDVQLIQSAGASVSHCPKSNAKLGHGIAPLLELLEAGVPTGLGTDGAVSNNGCDFIEEARSAVLFQRARAVEKSQDLDARAMLRLMTLGGAEALGLEAEVGSLEPGKCADLTALSLSAPPLKPSHDPETSIIFSASSRDVILTVVEGKVLFRDGEVKTLDEEELRGKLEGTRARLRRG